MSDNSFFAALVMFLASFILYSLSAGLEKPRIYKLGRYACILGALASSIGLISRWISSGHPPLSNMYESMVTLATFTAWFTVIFTRKKPLALVEGGSVVIALLMLGISSLFPDNVRPLVPVLRSYWLHIHVSLAFVGESCFVVAFVMSYLFCLKRIIGDNEEATDVAQTRKFPAPTKYEKVVCAATVAIIPAGFLAVMGYIAYGYHIQGSSENVSKVVLFTKTPAVIFFILLGAMGLYFARKKAGKLLPDAELLDELTYRAIALGYPLFTIGALIFGMVWANKAWGRYWGWDPKETWSLITFLVYSIYLHARLTRGWRGTGMAILSIIGFLVTVFTLFGVNLLLSGLHAYG